MFLKLFRISDFIPSLVIMRLLIPKSIPITLSLTGKGLIVGSSNLIEICQRPDGCNLTVTVLGSQYEGICLDHRIGKGSKHLAK